MLSSHEEKESKTANESKMSFDYSVVKINKNAIDSTKSFYSPWIGSGFKDGIGSGFIFKWDDKNLILTNAHVTEHARFIKVSFPSEPSITYTASMLAVDHSCDLALLRVTEVVDKQLVDHKKFWSKAKPLTLATERSNAEDPVTIVGFPSGGSRCAITQGNISRIELTRYAHPQNILLTAHLSGSALPGNSGGPVLTNNKVVGIAHQIQVADKAAQMVPLSIIKHFLKSHLDFGMTAGIPSLTIAVQTMENIHLRRHYSMDDELTGVLINKIASSSPAKGILQPNDVLLQVGKYVIDNLGLIQHDDCASRLPFQHAIFSSHMNETLPFVIWRNKEKITVEVKLTLRIQEDYLLASQYDKAGDYIYRCGIFILPLTQNYCQAFTKSDYKPHIISLLGKGLKKSPAREQILFIRQILGSEDTHGYNDQTNNIVLSINGIVPRNLFDAMNAFDSNTNSNHIIKTCDTEFNETGTIIVPTAFDDSVRVQYGNFNPESMYYGNLKFLSNMFFNRNKIITHKKSAEISQESSAINTESTALNPELIPDADKYQDAPEKIMELIKQYSPF